MPPKTASAFSRRCWARTPDQYARQRCIIPLTARLPSAKESGSLFDGQGSGIDNWEGGKPGDPPGQLYQIEADRHEDNNLYNDHPEIVEKLRALLDKYKQQGHSRLRPKTY